MAVTWRAHTTGQNTIHPNWSADSKRVIYCTNDDLSREENS
jgi:hypothetical protein